VYFNKYSLISQQQIAVILFKMHTFVKNNEKRRQFLIILNKITNIIISIINSYYW